MSKLSQSRLLKNPRRTVTKIEQTIVFVPLAQVQIESHQAASENLDGKKWEELVLATYLRYHKLGLL